jgi:hypothetical protein
MRYETFLDRVAPRPSAEYLDNDPCNRPNPYPVHVLDCVTLPKVAICALA